MKKKNLYILLVVIIVVVLIIVFSSPKEENGKAEMTNEPEEKFLTEEPEEGSTGEKAEQRIQGLKIPKPGDIMTETEIAVPENVGSDDYYIPMFRAELNDGKLSPSEFRNSVENEFRVSILNKDDKDYELKIIDTLEGEINRLIKANGKEIIVLHTLVEGQLEITCNNCAERIIGRIVVLPEKIE